MLKPPRVTIYKQAEDQKRAFIATVKRYNVVAQQSGSVQVDTDADYSWEDVMSAQETFFQERQSVTSEGVRGSVNKHLRKFGDNSETFQSWLKLLPTDSHYLSVLCGGLTLILGVSRLQDLDTCNLAVLTSPRLRNRCLKFEKASVTS